MGGWVAVFKWRLKGFQLEMTKKMEITIYCRDITNAKNFPLQGVAPCDNGAKIVKKITFECTRQGLTMN